MYSACWVVALLEICKKRTNITYNTYIICTSLINSLYRFYLDQNQLVQIFIKSYIKTQLGSINFYLLTLLATISYATLYCCLCLSLFSVILFYFALFCFCFRCFLLCFVIGDESFISSSKINNCIMSQPLELLWCPSSWPELIKHSPLDVTSDFVIRLLTTNNSAWKPFKNRRNKSIVRPFCHRYCKISTVSGNMIVLLSEWKSLYCRTYNIINCQQLFFALVIEDHGISVKQI